MEKTTRKKRVKGTPDGKQLTFDSLPILMNEALNRLEKIERQLSRLATSGDEKMNIATTARFLGVTRQTVSRMVRDGEIPFVTVGERVMFIRAELAEWLRNNAKYQKNDVIPEK